MSDLNPVSENVEGLTVLGRVGGCPGPAGRGGCGLPFSHFGDHAPSQAVKDALADAETLRLFVDATICAALSDARYFGSHAKDYVADGWPAFSGWLASRAAHCALLAVPGLRG